MSDGFLGGGEGFVLHELESSAVIDQRVARDARGVVIGFGEASVDDHHASFGFDGTFSACRSDGDVPVDDVTVRSFHSEGIHDVVTHLGFGAQSIVCSFLLRVCVLFCEEVAFEGCHFSFVEERRVWSAPKIPKEVSGFFSEFWFRLFVVGGAHQKFRAVQQFFSCHFFAFDFHSEELAVFVHRDGGVVEQVGVANAIHSAVVQELSDVGLESFAGAEGVGQSFDEFFLFRCQRVWSVAVKRGPEGVVHCIFLSFHLHFGVVSTDSRRHVSVRHFPFRVFVVECSLKFELDDRDGFVHLCHHAAGFFLQSVFLAELFRLERFALVFAVGFHGKGGERKEIDAVAFLQGSGVGIAQRETQHRRHAGRVSGCRSHPKNVVVSPLNVPVVVAAEAVHDEVRTGAAVIDVTEDVQAVDGKSLNQFAECDDETFGASRFDDGANNHADISLFVVVVRTFVKEFFDDIGKLLGEAFAHF